MASWLSFEVPAFMKSERPVTLTARINSRQRRQRYRALTLEAQSYETWPPAIPKGDDSSDTQFLTSFVRKIQEAEKENTSEINNHLRLLTSSAAMQEVRKVTAVANASITSSSISSSSSLSSSTTFINDQKLPTIDIDDNINSNNNNDDSNTDRRSPLNITGTDDITAIHSSRPSSTITCSTTSTTTYSPSSPASLDNDANDSTKINYSTPSTLATVFSSSSNSLASSSSQISEYGRSLTSIYSGTTLNESIAVWGQDGACDDAQEIEVDEVLDCYV